MELDFGAEAFNGDARRVQIEVRNPHDPSDTEPFTVLSPRQPLAASPYAIHAIHTRGLLVDEQGRLGIFTTTPGFAVDVNGGVRSSRPGTDHSIEIKGNSLAGGSLVGRSPRSQKRGMTIASFFVDDGGPTSGSTGIIFKVGNNIGGGTEAMRITEEGDVGIGASPPDVRFHVAGGTDAAPSGGGHIQAGDTSGPNVVIDENEIMARNNGQVSNLHINNNGGDVIFGGLIDIGYEVVSRTDTIRAGFDFCTQSVRADCPPGKRVLGGGCDQGSACDQIVVSSPCSNGGCWICEVDAGLVGDAEITAFAICANVK